jgi:signal transduction histidine kinase
MSFAADVTHRELDALLKVSTALTSSLELSNVLQTAIDGAVDILAIDSGAIYLIEQGELLLGATTPSLPPDFPDEYRKAPLGDHPHIQRCLQSDETVFIHDSLLADLTSAERGVCEARELKTVFYIPLTTEEVSIGVFIVGSSDTRAFTPKEESLCRTLSHQVALAITNSRLYESVQIAYSQLEEAQAELLKNNEDLARMNEDLNKAKEVRDRFLALMSHELRTPLTVINGYLSFILDRGFGKPTPELRDILSTMKEQGQNQLILIEDLMNLARLDSGHFQLVREPCQPGELVGSVIKAFRPLQEEKDIEVTLDLAPDLPTVSWDHQKMNQVFQNLVGNALKFTPSGGRVSVSVYPKSDFVEFRVSDNGIGIPEEIVKQIFDRFFQADSSPTRQYEGSGLGLTFAQEIIHSHEGKIIVESEEGAGTTFIVLIPPGEMTDHGDEGEKKRDPRV